MATTFEKPRDVVGGLLILAIGAGFLLLGRELPVGSSFRMGPGYFPTVLSWVMVALGAAMAGLAWRAPHQEDAFGHVPWRGLVLVLGATVAFGLGLRGFGLAPVLVLVVFATAWASRYATWRGSVLLALGIGASDPLRLTIMEASCSARGVSRPKPSLRWRRRRAAAP